MVYKVNRRCCHVQGVFGESCQVAFVATTKWNLEYESLASVSHDVQLRDPDVLSVKCKVWALEEELWIVTWVNDAVANFMYDADRWPSLGPAQSTMTECVKFLCGMFCNDYQSNVCGGEHREWKNRDIRWTWKKAVVWLIESAYTTHWIMIK